MDDTNFHKKLQQLESEFDKLADQLSINQQKQDLDKYYQQMSKPNFWQKEKRHTQDVNQNYQKLKTKLKDWLTLETQINTLKDQLEIVKQLSDEKFTSELTANFNKTEDLFSKLKQQLRFKGKYDNCEIALSIFAGAGGVDAQDWTNMLFRMYSRWADQSSVKLELISQSSGEEAGLKSVCLYLKNQPFLYGKLKGEHGVHRLVRLSPFNANNLRQTSFAKVEVLPILEDDSEIKLDDSQLRFDYFRSGGAGGQSVNTTDSAVRVTHLPTKISVSIQNERSQLQNKQLALDILRFRLNQLRIEQQAQRLEDLKGNQLPNQWGSQIRNYILHPYKQVKDLRTGYVNENPHSILDGNLDDLLTNFINMNITS